MNALEHIDSNVWDNNKRIQHVEKDFIMSDIIAPPVLLAAAGGRAAGVVSQFVRPYEILIVHQLTTVCRKLLRT